MIALSEIRVATALDELKSLRQWVCWKTILRGGKLTKAPISAGTGSLVDVTDPQAWQSYERACWRVLEDGLDGVGFALSREDNYTVIDLDHCFDEHGSLLPWARQVISVLNSYAELSPSGSGIHVWCMSNFEGGRRRGPVEVYACDRYVTVTGEWWESSAPAINQRSEEVRRLLQRMNERVERVEVKARLKHRTTPDDDTDLIQLAMSEKKHGAQFAQLWSGNWAGFASQSEADLALCNRLVYWTKGDLERVDRLFRLSGLYREKWDKGHGTTYGERTIAAALR